jgi:hypothetical protein
LIRGEKASGFGLRASGFGLREKEPTAYSRQPTVKEKGFGKKKPRATNLKPQA